VFATCTPPLAASGSTLQLISLSQHNVDLWSVHTVAQAKDELRVARMVRSPFFDGFQPQWFHLDCFFIKNAWGAKSPSELQGVTDLRPDDQKSVADGFAKMAAAQGTAAAGGAKAKGKGKKEKGGAAAAAAPPPDRSMELLAADGSALLRVEHAKSSRAGCRYCEVKINKDVLRLGVMMEPDENSESSFRGMRTWWYAYHAPCSVVTHCLHEFQIHCASVTHP
jgi:hypothetical protein